MPGGGDGCPRIPLCYSNSLGPQSHTTVDPLSPPCVLWDAASSNGGTPAGSIGVDQGSISVAVTGIDLRAHGYTDDAVNCSAAPPRTATPTGRGDLLSINGNAVYDFLVLCHYFQTSFQTYQRSVVLHFFKTTPLDVSPYFAVLQWRAGFWAMANTPLHVPNVGTQFFDFQAVNIPSYYSSRAIRASPNFWSGLPSTDEILSETERWVCRSLAGKPPTYPDATQSAGAHGRLVRKIALAYNSDSTAVADDGSSPVSYMQNTIIPQLSRMVDSDPDCAGKRLYDGHVFDMTTWGSGFNEATFTAAGPESGQAGDSPLRLRDAGDTSILCLFCGGYGYPLYQAESARNFFPEFIFVAGSYGNSDLAREYDQQETRLFDGSVNSGVGVFNNAFGISELWQLSGYANTYWNRAFSSLSQISQITESTGLETYELLMQLFAAVQLAGPALTPEHMAHGDARNPQFTGLYGWQRSFVRYDTAAMMPSSPAAGYGDVHTFLKGMQEERWDSTGVAAGGPYNVVFVSPNGCFVTVDWARFSGSRSDPSTGLAAWPTDDRSAGQYPCTGDVFGDTPQ